MALLAAAAGLIIFASQNGTDGQDSVKTASSRIESLPISILIDRTGQVAKTYVGVVREATFAKDVERLLTEDSVNRPKTTAEGICSA